MDILQVIKTRKSIRTFDNRKITENDKQNILNYVESIENPYDIPVEFVFLDKEEFNLSSPVIEGEDFYIAAKVPKTEHCEEAFGYSFEKLILYLWSQSIGTTWIGGTFDREHFEKAASTKDDEYMMIVTPVGYPSNKRSKVDIELRETVKGDERKPLNELFFENDFSTPISSSEDWMEAIQWAPSAANRQPWRIIKDNNKYHFYEEHTKGYTSNVGWDVQKVDIGIALCHFMSVKEGKLIIDNPDIKTDEYTEYIATVLYE